MKPACLPRGRIDAAHPAAVRFARERGIKASQLLRPAAPTKAAAPTTAPAKEPAIIAGPDPLEALLDWTVRRVVETFGSSQGLLDWLAARKQIAELARVESRNKRDEGRLVSRLMVEQHCFAYLESLNRRMLKDLSHRLAKTVLAAARAGETSERIERMISESVSSDLSRAKREVIRGLDASRTGDNPPALVEHEATKGPVTDTVPVLALRDRLTAEVAPLIVELTLKAAARSGAGGRNFDELMSAFVALQGAATRQTSNILTAHIDHVARAHRERETPNDDRE